MADLLTGSPAQARLALELPWQFIQALRLAQALMESDYSVHVPDAEAWKLEYLRRFFSFSYRTGTDGVRKLEDIEVLHRSKEPRTRVGGIARPLIFPHAVVERCHTMWPEERPIRFAFCGLVTAERKPVLASWIRASGGSALRFRFILANLSLKRRLPWLAPEYHDRKLGVTIWPSRRGREWPGKLWDEEYVRILTQSQFVLCPDGKYIWSYRFFESILCGAIPVVDTVCDAYRGLHFYRLGDPPERMEWSRQLAEENFAECAKRLTVPRDELNRELGRLLAL
jgi:hypothetical protein